MTTSVEKRPYEFLVRWDRITGRITGAHVGFSSIILEDGAFKSEAPEPVMSVNIGQGVGFPLTDILSQIHVDAIAAMESAREQLAAGERAAKTAIEEAQATAAEAGRDAEAAIAAADRRAAKAEQALADEKANHEITKQALAK